MYRYSWVVADMIVVESNADIDGLDCRTQSKLKIT